MRERERKEKGEEKGVVRQRMCRSKESSKERIEKMEERKRGKERL